MPRLLRVGLLIHVCSSISQVELNICSMLALALHTDNPALPVCSVTFFACVILLRTSCCFSFCSFVSCLIWP